MISNTVGNDNIEIIQGDSFEMTVTIDGLAESIIENIYFTCASLRFCQKLEKEEGTTYLLKISSEITKTFEPAVTNYDLTIYFIDKTIQTIVHNAALKVLRKNNAVTCNE